MKNFSLFLEDRGRPKKKKQSFNAKSHMQKMEQFKTDLRRMNKIYRDIDPKVDTSNDSYQVKYTKDSYKRFFEAKKLFNTFAKNFERWVFYELLDRTVFGDSEETYFQVDARKAAWAAFADIGTGLNFPEAWSGSMENNNPIYRADLDRYIRERDKNVRTWNKSFNKAFEEIKRYIIAAEKADEVAPSDENIAINGVNFKILSAGKEDSDDAVIKNYLQNVAPSVISIFKKAGFNQLLRKLSVELDFGQSNGNSGEYLMRDKGVVKIFNWGMITSKKESQRVLIHEIAHRFYYMLLKKSVRDLWENIIEKYTFIVSDTHVKTLENLIDDKGKFQRNAFRVIDSISDPKDYVALNFLAHETTYRTRKTKEDIVSAAKKLIGKNTYKEYITDYAGKNGSEAFAEALTMYLLHGPRRLGPFTRNLLKKVVATSGVILKEEWEDINNIKGVNMKSFINFINESSLKPGDWITDGNIYALIIDRKSSKDFSILKYESGKVVTDSTKGWESVKVVDMKNVPSKIQDKIMDKAEKYL